ncbi:hypothetical protein QAD02_022056 [Eretmocerus hayati]|uniref:Uncharacterized protein n=1 Tax=Eretmocerus hayati TaxID=131215 RepID=A0ACC2PV63_9HYME|nr:hypothetical protein QAD02_022056 [Eretmocerus hayati]
MKGANRLLCKLLNFRKYHIDAQPQLTSLLESKVQLPRVEYDKDFFCNPDNRDLIHNNIVKRKSTGDIDKVLELSQNGNAEEELIRELGKIPNLTYPQVLEYGDDEPFTLRFVGDPPKFRFKPREFSQLAEKLKFLRTDRLGPVSGSRSYILLGDLAELEQALVQYTLKELLKNGFQLISVPDILPSQVIERCGLISSGERRLVYQIESLYGDELSLSGTAEMALAFKLSDKLLPCAKLPLKLAAVSRCYRAEVSNLSEERGIYRVHQFTKVEMFICSQHSTSTEIMDSIVEIQEILFKNLGLHFKILDMPPNELGSPAYRKIDIEAWMPGRQQFGEISSCSNCTDYQARRLNIKCEDNQGSSLHAHTLNGTACAIPRMLIALCETHQTANHEIAIPDALVPYMNGKKMISSQNVPDYKQYKIKSKP